ncbi:MAG: ATP-binding cassette domain-containing protein [Campylobacterales bacterium]|nr:ATP-binding cassette domain-containing protein [Campylobacterales bacterium]
MLKLDNYSNYILDDISLSVKEQNLIILGSNGCGKTTLAKAFSGLLDNSKLDTKLVNYIPTKLDIFDSFLSVKEFLDLSCLHGKCTIDEVCEILDISDLKEKNAKTLSSGESQLVLLASAILHSAKYTILDEPTSNLDPQKVKRVFRLLKDDTILNYKVIITHNLDLAYKLGFDVIYIKDGKIDFSGTGQEFFAQDNLDKYFDKSVKNIDGNIVVSI